MMVCLGFHFMAVAFIAIGYITLYLELLASMQLTCMHDCVDTNQFTYFIYLGMWGGMSGKTMYPLGGMSVYVMQ